MIRPPAGDAPQADQPRAKRLGPRRLHPPPHRPGPTPPTPGLHPPPPHPCSPLPRLASRTVRPRLPSPSEQPQPISCGLRPLTPAPPPTPRTPPQLWYKYIHMEEMLGNVAGARQVFERWMQWEPDHQARGTTHPLAPLCARGRMRARGAALRASNVVAQNALPRVRAGVGGVREDGAALQRGRPRPRHLRALRPVPPDGAQRGAGRGSAAYLYILCAGGPRALGSGELGRSAAHQCARPRPACSLPAAPAGQGVAALRQVRAPGGAGPRQGARGVRARRADPRGRAGHRGGARRCHPSAPPLSRLPSSLLSLLSLPP